jgi:hypothetical protein
MGSQLQLARRPQPASTPAPTLPISPCQLDFVLDDVRLRGMTPAERQVTLKSLAHLLLEASGVAMREATDDRA